MQDSKATLLILAQDTEAAQLLARSLLEQPDAPSVAVLCPSALPPEPYAGATLFDARRLQPQELGRWFESSGRANVLDLGALPPESIEFLRMQHGASISRYLYCSSAAIYAPNLPPPITENAPLREDSPTLRVERYLEGLRGRFPFTILRSSPIYGEGRGLLAYFFDRFLFGDGIVVCPRDPDDAIQPIYVEDWVECVKLLLEHEAALEQTFNVTGREWIALREFLGKASAATEEARKSHCRIFQARASEIPAELATKLEEFPLPGQGHQIYSADKLRRLCGYEPKTPLEQGLELGFQRYLEQAGAIENPNLAPELELIERLQLAESKPQAEAEPFATPTEATAPDPIKPSAGQMGAPMRMATGGAIAQIRRPRDPSELPPPPMEVEPELRDQRLDEMADMMLSGVNREGENEMQLEMKDEVLGGLHIKIAQKQRRVRALFGCKHRDSRATIEENFPRLRRKLEQRGYFVLELVATILT